MMESSNVSQMCEEEGQKEGEKGEGEVNEKDEGQMESKVDGK